MTLAYSADQVNYINAVTEGLCARHAIFRANVVVDWVGKNKHAGLYKTC